MTLNKLLWNPTVSHFKSTFLALTYVEQFCLLDDEKELHQRDIGNRKK